MNIIIFHIFKRKEKKLLKFILDNVQFIDNHTRHGITYTSTITEKAKLPAEEIDSVLFKLQKENIVHNMALVGGKDHGWVLTQNGLELMYPDSYKIFKEGLKIAGGIIGIAVGLAVLFSLA